jgi:hypothetical protein
LTVVDSGTLTVLFGPPATDVGAGVVAASASRKRLARP